MTIKSKYYTKIAQNLNYVKILILTRKHLKNTLDLRRKFVKKKFFFFLIQLVKWKRLQVDIR